MVQNLVYMLSVLYSAIALAVTWNFKYSPGVSRVPHVKFQTLPTLAAKMQNDKDGPEPCMKQGEDAKQNPSQYPKMGLCFGVRVTKTCVV
jgi:hypothetical protein